MKVLIIEDEHLAAEKLVHLLEKAEPGAEVLDVLESVEESINWFSSHPAPDLVFMDIQLDDGISFEIFDTITINAPIIFTTAYDEYAIRAFKVNSVDYLLKPIESVALNAALDKFKNIFLEQKSFEERVSRVIEQISKTYKSRFFIKVGIRFQSIPVNEICCFLVEERATFLKTETGKSYDLDFSLDHLQTMVDPKQFFRVNRNFLVNINCIREILSYSGSRLKLKLCTPVRPDVVVSRDKVSEFKRWMDR